MASSITLFASIVMMPLRQSSMHWR